MLLRTECGVAGVCWSCAVLSLARYWPTVGREELERRGAVVVLAVGRGGGADNINVELEDVAIFRAVIGFL